MGKQGSKAGWTLGACLMTALLSACTSPTGQQDLLPDEPHGDQPHGDQPHGDQPHGQEQAHLESLLLESIRLEPRLGSPLHEQSLHGKSLHKKVRARPSVTIDLTSKEPVSIHGRLVSRATGSPVGAKQPRFVVVLSTPTGGQRAVTPPTLVRDAKGFSPTLGVVPLGARLRFDNRDKIFHSFFSTSTGNEFDLKPLDPGNSAFIRFQHTGLVHIYCSLHSGHRASVLVLPSANFARVGANGEFDIDGIPPGRHVLEVWSQNMPHQGMEVFVTGSEIRPIEFPIDTVPAKAGR